VHRHWVTRRILRRARDFYLSMHGHHHGREPAQALRRQALTDVLGNHAPSPLHLGVMAFWAAVGIVTATRWFRWE
jgi:hypothetical protein